MQAARLEHVAHGRPGRFALANIQTKIKTVSPIVASRFSHGLAIPTHARGDAGALVDLQDLRVRLAGDDRAAGVEEPLRRRGQQVDAAVARIHGRSTVANLRDEHARLNNPSAWRAAIHVTSARAA